MVQLLINGLAQFSGYSFILLAFGVITNIVFRAFGGRL